MSSQRWYQHYWWAQLWPTVGLSWSQLKLALSSMGHLTHTTPVAPHCQILLHKANTPASCMNIDIDQILLKLFCLNSINPISEPPLVCQILQSFNDRCGSLLNVPLDIPVSFGLGSPVLDIELQLCFTRDEQREKDHFLWLYDYDLPNTAHAAV